jgi:hypothetical protein
MISAVFEQIDLMLCGRAVASVRADNATDTHKQTQTNRDRNTQAQTGTDRHRHTDTWTHRHRHRHGHKHTHKHTHTRTVPVLPGSTGQRPRAESAAIQWPHLASLLRQTAVATLRGKTFVSTVCVQCRTSCIFFPNRVGSKRLWTSKGMGCTHGNTLAESCTAAGRPLSSDVSAMSASKTKSE